MSFLYDGISMENGRSTNMDSLLLSSRTIAGHPALLAVVCDGVGSMADGAFAASHAVKLINEWFLALTDLARIGLKMRDAVLQINHIIIEQARASSLNTASTLTALLFSENKYYGVHIGDSRAYRFDSNGIATLLTVDDVSESGKLTGCIGRFENPVLLCTEGDANACAFLICSDGLYKRTDIHALRIHAHIKHAKDIKKLINRLAENAIQCGEKDNISLAIIIPKTEGAI